MRKAKQVIALAMTAALAAGLMSGCSTKKAAVEEPSTAQETTGATAAEEPETTAAETVTYDEEKNADVIIVGAGGAGLSAAIAAVDAGAKSVIIVEKLGKTGGSLNFTSGSMSGAETIIQELDGICLLYTSITREELAEVVFLNEDYMSRLFRKQEGISLTQYMTDRKIEKAKELLEVPDITVTMAAEEIGITNFHYFSKIFKREVGISPSEYKRRCQKSKRNEAEK